MMKTFLLAAIAAGSAAPALAETGDWRQAGFYLGAGPAGSAIGNDAADEAIGFSSIQLRGGFILNKYLSFEGQAALPLGNALLVDDGFNDIEEVEDVELKSEYGLFVQPRLPIGKSAGVYARLGYMSQTVDFNTDGPGPSFEVESDGAAVGLGVDFDIGRHFTIAIDYTVMDSEYDAAASGGLFLKGRF